VRSASIPVSFLDITGQISAAPNLALMERVQAEGVDPQDTAAVTAVWQRLVAEKQAPTG